MGEAKNPGPSRQANLGSYFPVSQHLPRNLQTASAACAPARPGPAAQQDLRNFFPARPGPLQNPGAVPFSQNGTRRAPVRSAVAAAPSEDEQPRDSCVIAVVNPASILHKTHPLLETAADVICLSETSAVSQVQGLVGHQLRQHGFKTIWGAPVPSHQREGSDKICLRGLAAGVAVTSRLPCRAASPALPQATLATCRIGEAFIRLGVLEVRLLTVYGYPLSYPDARERTEELMSQVLVRATSTCVPTIIAGDFNCPVLELPSGAQLHSLGYREIFELHERTTGTALPPTCKGATRHDTALLHPTLLPLWHSAWVLDKSHLFDSHDPLCFRLKVCSHQPTRRSWNLPRAWSSLSPEPAAIQAAFRSVAPALARQARRCTSEQEVAQTLLAFSQSVEDCVDTALSSQHAKDPLKYPHRCLPKAYRGRCVDRPIVQRTVPSVVRPARTGDYTPDEEVTSVQGHMRVRQVRRAQTLLRGLLKLHRTTSSAVAEQLRTNLTSEWSAFRKAKGFPPDFVTWTLRIACFNTFPEALPSPDWLSDLLAYLQFDCNAFARSQAKQRRDSFKYKLVLDQKHGHHRGAFQTIRGPTPPPFTEVPCQVSVQLSPSSRAAPAAHSWFQFVPGPSLRIGAVASLDHTECHVIDVAGDHVLLQGETLRPGLLVQDSVACTASELHRVFSDFWSPLWQRDHAMAPGLDHWPEFGELVAGSNVSLPPVSLSSISPDVWSDAIKRMSSRKATGVCGWAVSDLKLLPPEAVEVLQLIFERAVQVGMPAHMLQARVSVLAKVFAPDSIRQSRPITIYSTLYRVWSSCLTRKVLKEWAPHFPENIAGSLPGRSSRDLSYRQQHAIECALVHKRPRLGLSIDIVKCFNQLGWAPLYHMLHALGLPRDVLEFWFNCLSKMERRSAFLGDLGPAIRCYNGAPEGDPFSVAAMAGLCFWAHNLCATDGVVFDSYVDNWAWSGESTTAVQAAVPKALRFLDSLRLPIDWKKSYLWATQRPDRLWWQKVRPHLFPPDCPVPLVCEAKDLGIAYKYDGRVHRVARNHRLEEGTQRLERLRQQPRSVLEKASLIQRGIWPQCLYGSEGHAFSLADLQTLRGKAARAITGHYSILSPHLALGALTDCVQDPQLYCAEQQLLALRRACLRDTFTACSVVALANERVGVRQVHGPATALAVTLQRLGLSMDDDACIKGPDNSRVYLSSCSRKEVRGLLERAWSLQVQHCVKHRNGLHVAPPPLPHATGQLLSKLAAGEQGVIARHITGAFASAQARAQWDECEDGVCPLCGAKQTKAHKFLECPALSHIRQQWEPHISVALRIWPHWLHGPYAGMAPDLEVTRLVFATRKLLPPVVPAGLTALLRQRQCLRLFTDGSCSCPHLPEASRAAWAVVMDASEGDTEIPTLLQQWRWHRRLPTCFHVVDQGLVPGVQSINRAETIAILQAARLASSSGAPSAEIWTDSTFAMSEWQRALAGSTATWPDLGEELQQVASVHITVHKVSSHQNLDDLWGLEQWLAAGNHVVDTAAKAALQREFPVVQAITGNAADFFAEQRDLLWLFWRYLLQVSQEECRLLRQLAKEIKAHGAPAQNDKQEVPRLPCLATWEMQDAGPFQSWQIPAASREWLLACSWPPWFTVPLWGWLSGLQWSQQPLRKKAVTGATYLELVVDFVASTKVCPPHELAAARALDKPPKRVDVPCTLRQVVFCFVEAVRQLERLSGHRLLPARRGKVFSLRSLQEGPPRIGVSIRPRLPTVQATGPLLVQVLQDHSTLPLFATVQDSEIPLSELQRCWRSFSDSERSQLGRALRRSRKTGR